MRKVTKNNLTITALLLFCFTVLFMTLPAAGEEVTPQIAAGSTYTIVLKADGTLWAWGYNYSGQLGDGTTTDRWSPVQTGTDSDWVSIAAGQLHNIAQKADDTLWAWGDNDSGQLGDGTTTDRWSPVQIGTDSDWVSIAAGYLHTIALKSDGTLWAWGANYMGQLGDGTTTPRLSPVQTGTDSDWVSIAAGYLHNIAQKADGTLWAWGANAHGQLGDGTTTNRWSPVQTGTDTDWVSIAAGQFHTIALKADDTLWAWGNNYSGQLGDGTTTNRLSPVQTGTDTDWVSIAAGSNHTIAQKADGTLWAWGYNNLGQLGDGTTTERWSPVQTGTDSDWVSIAAGNYHNIAQKADDTLWAWGWNSYGQLGDGTTTDRWSPVLILITPVPEPDINVSPTSLDLGDVLVGNSSNQDVTVSNTGTADLTITDISISGSTDFSQTNDCSILASGNSCTITVTFTPSSTGSISGDLSIESDDPDESPLDVALSGTGTSLLPLTLVVTTTADFGSGSLCQAIQEANANLGLDTIEFEIPGTGPHTIQPTTALPTITDPVIIDGYTQAGSSEATDITPATLMIEIRGPESSPPSGLRISAGGSTVRGLVLNRLHYGIYIYENGGNTVAGNHIGTDVSGTVALGNNADGIWVNNTANNTIGGTTAGARNIVVDNNYGVLISGASATNNQVLGNYIGTDASGTIGLGIQTDGLRISSAPNNTVGGTTSGSRNVFSGGDNCGVAILGAGATGNQILGNYIGTDVTGTLAIGNGRGVGIESAASNNVVGGSTPGSGNLISGNTHRGMDISSLSNHNVVQGNFIGTDATGTAAMGNGSDGIMIHTSSYNLIGGTTPGARNIISGNGVNGISILANPGAANTASSNRIEGNFIGTDVTGTSALGNVRGIYFWGAAHDNIIGGLAVGAANTISRNTDLGVRIQDDAPDGAYAIHNTISRNSITGNGSIAGRGISLSNDANELIEPPLITAVTASQVSGTSTAPDSSIIEIFQDPGDQGKVYIGSTLVSGSTFTFTGTPPPGATGGNLTATVTDPDGNTSEFSLSVPNNLSVTTASVWRIETVDSSEDRVGTSSSIALDSSDNPHISYRDDSNGDLKYAYYDGSIWNIETVDATGNLGYSSSIALDTLGSPHISYEDWTNGYLKYAYYDGSWNIETVDATGDLARYPSIALDTVGYPHISYIDYFDRNLKYAYYDGSWNIETVDTAGQIGYFSSIALNLNYPHISYFDWSNYNLKYAYYDGSIWNIETVDTAGDVGFRSSIALDSSGNPHISYLDLYNADLKYAYYDGSIWNIETIDATGNVGWYSSIALDIVGNPHISYLDSSNGNLKYAYYDGSIWNIETVDSSHSVGCYSSIALDSSGNPHISHLDLANGDLKYAYKVEVGISDSATVTTNEGDLAVSISEGSFSVSPGIVEPGAGIPDGFLTPYGAVSFTILTDPGATVTVILTLPEAPPAGTILFKCINGACSPITDATISGNQVVFDVTDGGSLDEDFTVNGEIVEPNVLAVPVNPKVAVDIRPGSCPNPFNVNSSGVLPVAISGTNDFDVTTIDPETIRLAGVAPLRWALEDVATPYEPFTGKQTADDCTDAGPDGLTDLTLKFNTQELVQSLELLLGRELEDGEAVVVRLSGNLREAHGSAAFLGEDVVVVLKKGKK